MRNKLLLTLACVLTFTAQSFALHYDFSAVCETGQTLYYHYYGGDEAMLTYPSNDSGNPWDGYIMPTGELKIPNTFTYDGRTYNVKYIDTHAFYRCQDLTSVQIPNSVTSIYSGAFNFCYKLKSVNLPNSVTEIWEDPFIGCDRLTQPVYNDKCFVHMPRSYAGEYTIPSGIKMISGYAFSGCDRLESVIIAEGVQTIETSAFMECGSLKYVKIPNSVVDFGGYVFGWCYQLTQPVYTDNVFVYMPQSYAGDYVIPSGIKKIAGGAFFGCDKLTSVTMPNSIESIGYEAFWLCGKLENVKLPNNLITIEKEAFRECNSITDINIPDKVSDIGFDAFSYCNNLKNVNLSINLSELKGGQFSGSDNIANVQMSMFTPISENAFPTSANVTFKDVEIIAVNIDNAKFKITANESQKQKCTEYGLYLNEIYYKADQNGMVNVNGLNETTEYEVKPYLKQNDYYHKEVIIISPYSIKITTGELTADVDAKVSPTVLELIGSCNADKDQIIGYSYVVNGEDYDTPIITGLTPDTDYNVTVIAETTAGTAYNTKTFHTTSTIELTTNVPLVDINGKILFSATTNLSDYETNAGFEWRKLDAPESLISSSGYGTIFNGILEASATIVSTNVYWKARAYFESAEGFRAYGDWVTFDPSEYIVIEPTVHTYPAVINLDNTIDLSGYIVEGSDEIIEQGFEYWIANSTGLVNKVKSDDMYVTLSEYESGKEYIFRAYAQTIAKTYYGEEQKFTAPIILDVEDILADPDKSNVIVSDVMGMIYNIKNWDNLFGELNKGMYILHRGNKSQTILIE